MPVIAFFLRSDDCAKFPLAFGENLHQAIAAAFTRVLDRFRSHGSCAHGSIKLVDDAGKTLCQRGDRTLHMLPGILDVTGPDRRHLRAKALLCRQIVIDRRLRFDLPGSDANLAHDCPCGNQADRKARS